MNISIARLNTSLKSYLNGSLKCFIWRYHNFIFKTRHIPSYWRDFISTFAKKTYKFQTAASSFVIISHDFKNKNFSEYKQHNNILTHIKNVIQNFHSFPKHLESFNYTFCVLVKVLFIIGISRFFLQKTIIKTMTYSYYILIFISM